MNLTRRAPRFTLVTLACSLATGASFAGCGLLTDKPFDMTVGVGSTYNAANDSISGGTLTAAKGFTTASEVLPGGGAQGTFSALNSAYTPTSATVIRVGYQGLPLVLTATANSQAMTLNIPSLNISQTFAAQTTRDGNIADIKQFLKAGGGSVINAMQNQLAAASCINPIAGNPTSLQSNMAANDFFTAFLGPSSKIDPKAGTQEQLGSGASILGAGLGIGKYSQGGTKSSVTTIPLSYGFRSDIDPRRVFTISLPVTVIDVSGAKSYSGTLGGSYRYPINDDWSLTPSVSYGVVASADLGSVGAMLAGSVTSQYSIPMDGFDLSIGNMVGYYQSLKFNAGGYSFDPGIKNTVFRNGILAAIPTTIDGKKMSFEISFINTQYTGTAVNSKYQNEIGLTLGTRKGAASARTSLRAGVSLVQAQNGVNGVQANVGYWF